MRTEIYDQITGPCVRRIAYAGSPEKTLYLTFDDGPEPNCTPDVLNILKRHDAKATFFVIGERAQQNQSLLQEILNDGHTIGDHTINHKTSNYFKDKTGIQKWLDESSELQKSLHLSSVGFRSPLGIKTPALNQVLKEKKRPLVLWDVRFYDTNHRLTVHRVKDKLAAIKDGSIILLHDTHQGENKRIFLEGLEHLISECKKDNYRFLPLTEETILKSYLDKYETF